jgi:hypothetical protein
MKFMLMIRERLCGGPVEDPITLNRACRQWFVEQKETCTIDCAYYIAPRAGMCIMNAESHEQLLMQMRSFPAFGSSDIELFVLVDAVEGIDGNHRRLQHEQRQATQG